jgi:hypothetical protein
MRELPGIVPILGGIISLPRVFLSRVFGVFRPLESALLNELCNHVEPELTKTIRSQQSETSFVSCVSTATSEINLYRVKNIALTLERSRLLSTAREQFVLADMDITIAKTVNATVQFHVVRGVLFSLDFNANIGNVRGVSTFDLKRFRRLDI